MAVHPDLILMDIDLPGMNGMQALAELQTKPEVSRIPVIALSAHAMRKQIDDGLKAGFKEYMTKPLDIPRLLRIIREELG